MSEPDWLDDVIARRAYNDPRIEGSLLSLQLWGKAFEETLAREFLASLGRFVDTRVGRQLLRFCDWLARRLQPAGEE